MAVVAARPSTPARIPWTTILVYTALAAGAIVMLYPFAYMLSTSLKPPAQVYVVRSVCPKNRWTSSATRSSRPREVLQSVHVEDRPWSAFQLSRSPQLTADRVTVVVAG